MSASLLAMKHGVTGWTRICKEAREMARRYQCFRPDLVQYGRFRGRLGPYNLCFTLNTWEPTPNYVGSVSVLEQIGWVPADLWGMPAGVEIPQDAMLAVESWIPEHFDAARELLSDLFGPIIPPGDDNQRVIETRGLMVLSWLVPCTDTKIIKRGNDNGRRIQEI